MHELRCKRRTGSALVAGLALTLPVILQAFGAEVITNSSPADPAQLARTTCLRVEARFESEPNSAEAALEAGRAYFKAGEYATNKAERAILADKGIAASQMALALQTNFGVAHYYLGMNLGQLARTRGWAALNMVHELETQFKAAARLSPDVDYGGPHRNLGYLYRDTPSFSIGDKRKAAEHFLQAVKIAPNYPENRMSLIEGFLKWGERKKAREELKALEEILPEARQRFSGPAFAENWTDWEARLKEIRAKTHQHRRFLGIFGSDE